MILMASLIFGGCCANVRFFLACGLNKADDGYVGLCAGGNHQVSQ
jgi:hypothetical protein